MIRSVTLALLALGAALPSAAADATPAPTPAVSPAQAPVPTAAEVDALMTGAATWLRAQQQPDGSFLQGKQFVLGITQLSAIALVKAGAAKDDPAIRKALAYQERFRQPGGGFYNPEEGLENYGTSLGLQLLALTGGDAAQIKGAQDFLFGMQNATTGSITEGGIGYGSRGAGNEDISNTSYAITALRASGVPASDPRLQKALGFLERCQDLSAVNKLPWVKGSGGATYTPDESKAGGSWYSAKAGDPPPAMNPYGSVTYTLIASYLTLDLKPDDHRVKAALGWIGGNWRLDANPGMPEKQAREGLFYYYVSMAKTFDLLDQNSLVLKDGRTVDWRGELFAALRQRAQTTDTGIFWINDTKRWGEAVPQLVTAYTLQALARLKASL
ncbi:MAG: hypothetical protein RLZZ127_1173 [Planctomycetota bacterium]|jgi:squalene-hopene/tetraprenyl-beta-curcumene cyclase